MLWRRKKASWLLGIMEQRVVARIELPTDEAIAAAAAMLRAGGLVAFPTETVYGLGADATNALAVAKIFAAKRRPRFNPLIVHVTDTEAAARLGAFDARARAIAAAFWPGPLTLVVPRREPSPIAELATAGLATIALRVPASAIAQSILRATALPIAAPSANRSGHVSPTLAAHVGDDLGDRIDLIIDGGAVAVGIESTVLDLSGPEPMLLRPGAVTRAAIETALGVAVLVPEAHCDARPSSPGRLAAHYAPRAALRLDATTLEAGEALLGFGPTVPAHAGPTINLSARGDVVEAAAALYAGLRALDRAGTATIAVMPIPEVDLGEAINDRLRRAAAPRR